MPQLKKQYSIKEIFDTHIKEGVVVKEQNFLFLYDIIRYFRPKRVSHSISILELIGYLQENPKHCQLLGAYIKELLSQRLFGRMISEVGIPQDSSFFYELQRRISAKILPFQPEKDTLQYILNQVFYLQTDYLWIKRIDHKEFRILFELLGFKTSLPKRQGNPIA